MPARMGDQTPAPNLGSPVDSPGLETTGSGKDPNSQTMPPKTSEAPTNPAVRTVTLPLYGTWKPTVSGGTVGKRVTVGKEVSERGASVSAKRPVTDPRPKTAPDVRKRKPLLLWNYSPGRGVEPQTAADESGGAQTGEPCSKRRRGGPISGGNSPPQSEIPLPADAPSEHPEDRLPLLQPFLSLPRGWSPGTFATADAPGTSAPEAWCVEEIEGRRSVDSTGRFDGPFAGWSTSQVGNGGLGQVELGLRREPPVENSWPVELHFGPGREYPVLEERSGTTVAVSRANPPCKTGFCEANLLPKDAVNALHWGFCDPNGGGENSNYGVDDLADGVEDLNASISALLTDHMRALLDAQEAQLGDAGPECPVELTPGQIAKILDQQEQMRAALAYFKALTGLKPTGLSPSTGGNYSPGKPSLSGTQSYASETACRVVPVGKAESGLEYLVTGPENGFGDELVSAHAGTNLGTSDLGKSQNEREEPGARGPLLVPLASRTPLDALAESAEDTWQLDQTCFGGEWGAQGHVAGPLWAPPFVEHIELGSLF